MWTYGQHECRRHVDTPHPPPSSTAHCSPGPIPTAAPQRPISPTLRSPAPAGAPEISRWLTPPVLSPPLDSRPAKGGGNAGPVRSMPAVSTVIHDPAPSPGGPPGTPWIPCRSFRWAHATGYRPLPLPGQTNSRLPAPVLRLREGLRQDAAATLRPLITRHFPALRLSLLTAHCSLGTFRLSALPLCLRPCQSVANANSGTSRPLLPAFRFPLSAFRFSPSSP